MSTCFVVCLVDASDSRHVLLFGEQSNICAYHYLLNN